MLTSPVAATSINSRIRTRGPRSSRPACFTLIELVAVIAIAAVLAAIAVGSYGGSIANQQAQAAAHRIIADLAYLREYAITTNTSVTVQFSPGSGAYVINGGSNSVPASASSPGGTFAGDIGLPPYEARFVSVDFGGNMNVTFDRFGAPDSGGTVQLSVSDKVVTILFDAQTGKGTIQ